MLGYKVSFKAADGGQTIGIIKDKIRGEKISGSISIVIDYYVIVSGKQINIVKPTDLFEVISTKPTD
jgi:hypothetical protein